MLPSDSESEPSPSSTRYVQKKSGKTKVKQTKREKKIPYTKKKSTEVQKSNKKDITQEELSKSVGEKKIISRVPIARQNSTEPLNNLLSVYNITDNSAAAAAAAATVAAPENLVKKDSVKQASFLTEKINFLTGNVVFLPENTKCGELREFFQN